jgi:signal transduction histidine kinase
VPERAGARILVVDDELGIRQGVQRALRSEGHTVDIADAMAAARARIQQELYDLVLLDVMMPDGSGIDLIDPIHQRDPDTTCIIITGFATVELAVDAIKRGAYDFISKPFATDQLILAVNQGLERRRLSLESKRLAVVEVEAQELARAKAELERLDQVKSQLMLKVAHELRAPTAAAQSFLNLILAGYVSEGELQPILSRVQERLKQTLDVVSDLLDLARLRQAGEELGAGASAQPVADVLEASVDMFRQQAAEKDQDLKLEIKDRPTVVAQRAHLAQIWNNLISNAIKYTPKGGTIRVTLHLDGDQWVGSVADSGIGIGPEDLPHLFQDFYRTEQAKATGEIGTGLGLSIVRQIVESYGGRIKAESALGQGTRFTFFLPLSGAQAQPQQ